MFIVANEANVSMLGDEKIRVVERQWIVPSPLSVPAVYQSLAASLATHSGWRNQAVTVRRERRWTTAGDKPARELDRSTR